MANVACKGRNSPLSPRIGRFAGEILRTPPERRLSFHPPERLPTLRRPRFPQLFLRNEVQQTYFHLRVTRFDIVAVAAATGEHHRLRARIPERPQMDSRDFALGVQQIVRFCFSSSFGHRRNLYPLAVMASRTRNAPSRNSIFFTSGAFKPASRICREKGPSSRSDSEKGRRRCARAFVFARPGDALGS